MAEKSGARARLAGHAVPRPELRHLLRGHRLAAHHPSGCRPLGGPCRQPAVCSVGDGHSWPLALARSWPARRDQRAAAITVSSISAAALAGLLVAPGMGSVDGPWHSGSGRVLRSSWGSLSSACAPAMPTRLLRCPVCHSASATCWLQSARLPWVRSTTSCMAGPCAPWRHGSACARRGSDRCAGRPPAADLSESSDGVTHGTASASRPALQPRRPIPNQNTREAVAMQPHNPQPQEGTDPAPSEWRRPSPGTTRPITRVDAGQSASEQAGSRAPSGGIRPSAPHAPRGPGAPGARART